MHKIFSASERNAEPATVQFGEFDDHLREMSPGLPDRADRHKPADAPISSSRASERTL